MNEKTRRLTFGAMMTALSIVFLLLACYLPSGQLGFAAVTTVFAIIAVAEHGVVTGLLVYASSSILGFFLLPGKGIVYLYIIFFGIYPVVKYLCERYLKPKLQWAVKIVFFLAALSVTWFLIGKLLFTSGILDKPVLLVYIGGTAAFVLFDIGITKLLSYYINRISKSIKR